MTRSAETEILSGDGPDRSSIIGGGLIQQTESAWLIQVGGQVLKLPSDASPEQLARSFLDGCQSGSAVTPRCVIALAGRECFFAEFELPDSIDPKDRTAVHFELERLFPLDAEAMVSDYRIDPTSRRIAALAIESDRHKALVHALEYAGIEIVSIVPGTLLIARGADQWRREQGQQEQRRPGGTPFGLLLFGQSSTETLFVDSTGVRKWKRFSRGEDELRRHHSICVDPSPTVVVVGRHDLSFKPGGRVQWCDRTAAQLLAVGAEVALSGRWGRWPDFRRGDLAPGDPLYAVARPLRRLAATATLCFLLLSVAAWHRGRKIAAESEALRERQRSEFLHAFPGQRVPPLLMRTVRSEYSKTLGSRGRGDSIKLPTPATIVLGDLFGGLGHAQRVGGARFRLIDVGIVDGECSITVRAKDAIQIGTIAKSLESVGFRVAPPASEQIDPSKEEPIATYQSTISAVWLNGDDA